MADIPKERLQVQRKPFTATGIDMFGPLYVKSNRQTRSNPNLNKRYGIIFVCLTSRAIHLELVSDMGTDSFILSLRRFISRRGHVENIISDNGTNFIGGSNEIKEANKNIDRLEIAKFLTIKEIEWSFNPPLSPWMGGSWESLIKSVKRSLKVITKDRPFTEEALYTFLCEVEALLNSRPLAAISDDINDLEVLTPNHLIYGYHNKICTPISETLNLNIRSKWKSVQAGVNLFWKRWISEYLPTLTKRLKWATDQPNIRVGDLVIVRQNSIPRYHWPLGRVIKCFKGTDSIVRSVQLKLSNSEVTRPVQAICLLEHAEI